MATGQILKVTYRCTPTYKQYQDVVQRVLFVRCKIHTMEVRYTEMWDRRSGWRGSGNRRVLWGIAEMHLKSFDPMKIRQTSIIMANVLQNHSDLKWGQKMSAYMPFLWKPTYPITKDIPVIVESRRAIVEEALYTRCTVYAARRWEGADMDSVPAGLT